MREINKMIIKESKLRQMIREVILELSGTGRTMSKPKKSKKYTFLP